MLFSIHCMDRAGALQARLENYAAHRAHLNSTSTTIVLAGPSGIVEAAATGEALFSGGTWKLRGRVTVDGGSAQVGASVGGFVADLTAGATASPTDDSIAWRIDAVD